MPNLEKYTKNRTVNYLTKLGLNSGETQVYLKLLSLNASTIADITRKSNLARTSVKRNLDRLMQKGLVSKTTRNYVTKYIAESPEKLNQILSFQQIRLEDKLKEIDSFKHLLPSITSEILEEISSNTDNTEFLVRYFQGKNGFIEAHNRTLESKTKELYFLSNMDEWKKVFTDDYAYKFYVPERIKRGIFAKTLAIRSKLALKIQSQDNKYLREMRFLPKGFDFKPTIITYDNEVLIMISAEPHFSILIQQNSVAKMFRELFNFFWKRVNI
ncbi:hypothetical protein JW796_04475 [Candidatus Dojkabacteria bacterium]|nr:hypothetical protein [Candidatus Dojkabacteria bacterium]